MKQQINLYQPILKKKHVLFSADAILITTAIFCLGLMLIYFYQMYRSHELTSHLAQLKTYQAQSMNDIERLNRAIPQEDRAAYIENAIRQKLLEKKNKETVLHALSQQTFGNTKGFSAHVTGLANQTINGLWLTQIQILSGGLYINLMGSATEPELVPQLLQKLRNENSFKGKTFTFFEINRPTENAGYIDFTLKTIPEETPEGDS